jgi:hypothetical protein
MVEISERMQVAPVSQGFQEQIEPPLLDSKIAQIEIELQDETYGFYAGN